MVKLIRFLLITLILPLQLFAGPGSKPHVKVEIVQEEQSIQPGRPLTVAIHLTMEEGWHVYWKNPGDAGMPLQVEWQLPAGFQAGPLQWPTPQKFDIEGLVAYGYEKEVTLLSTLTPPKVLKEGETPFSAKIKWLVCSETTCQPGSGTAIVQTSSSAAPLFAAARAKMATSVPEITVVKKEGSYQLSCPHTLVNSSILKVEFFPEQKEMIDNKVAPKLITETPSQLTIEIQAASKTGSLKGILVLTTEMGQQAFEIDSSLSPSEDVASTTLAEETHSVLKKSSSSFIEGGLLYNLFFAFIGGMILNLMPCVLPVISFKVMSFVKMAGKSRALTLKHGIIFSLGVLCSFWMLAIVMLVLKEYGQSVGWGFQLQQPIVVVILASLFFLFALNLFGVFELGLSVASWAGQTQADAHQKVPGYASSFLSGVLATAVATPCTGPFLGTAIAFAFTIPAPQTLLIFTSLGCGMCFPYLLLTAFPDYLKYIPKPGPWMETFKQLMGFLMMATVLWLMWVFAAQSTTMALFCLLLGFLCFSIGAWIYGKGAVPSSSTFKRIIVYAIVAVCTFTGVFVIAYPREQWGKSHSEVDEWAGWEKFSPQRVAQLRAEGKPVLIDFTAKWCVTCQANHFVLASNSVEKKLADAGVVKMVADWTMNDPVITEELSKLGRNSVPVYVLYGNDDKKDPTILPQILTPAIVSSHVDEMLHQEEIALQ